jgi:hypothetical protein
LFSFSINTPRSTVSGRPVAYSSSLSGAASPAIGTIVDNVIEEVRRADRRRPLTSISVDGDEGYVGYFDKGFEKLLSFLTAANFGQEFRDFIRFQDFFWVSDWLHVLKNARTRLFRTTIFGNPRDVTAGARMDGIATAFEPSTTFTDDTPFGKMPDDYPLDLFTLRRAFVLYKRRSNIDEFLYVFAFVPWSQAVENRLFNVPVRIALLETLLQFFYVQYTLIMAQKVHPGVCQKRSPRGAWVTFATAKKLKRFICTLAGQLVGLLLEDPDLGLDRIGSHTEGTSSGPLDPSVMVTIDLTM